MIIHYDQFEYPPGDEDKRKWIETKFKIDLNAPVRLNIHGMHESEYLEELESQADWWDTNQRFVRPALLAEEETNYGGW